MRVIFRVDSSLFMGAGHVMRCLVLAQTFAKLRWSCEFICRHHPGNLNAYIQEKGFKVHILGTYESGNAMDSVAGEYPDNLWLGAPWQVDAQQTLSSLDPFLKYDLLVIDHYSIEKKWENIVRPFFDKMLAINDLENREHVCDYLLDQNFGREKKYYQNKVSKNCVVFAGSEYALLRPEFSRLRSQSISRRRGNNTIRKIAISMGGMDMGNMTLEILKSISGHPQSQLWELDVIMGRNSPHIKVVEKFAATLNTNVNVLIGVENMAHLLSQADLFIGGAGSTAWEACCLGVPLMIKVLAINQQSNALALERFGAAVLLEGEQNTLNQLLTQINLILKPGVLEAMHYQCSKITKGLGAEIIAGYLDPMYFPPTGLIREMEHLDLDMILDWRNHDDIRKFMIAKDIIAFEDHLRWYEWASSNPERWLLIYEENSTPMGFIQFEKATNLDGIWDWGFYSAPYAPKGVGHRMGKAALAHIFNVENALGVRGFVLAENEHSRKYHLRMGFREIVSEFQGGEKKHSRLVGYNLSRDRYCMIH